MKTLNIEIEDKAVNEFINSLDEKGILSNFIEQYCKSLLKGCVLATPEEELTKSDKSAENIQTETLQVVESELDSLLSEKDSTQESLTTSEIESEENNSGYFELNEDDLDISDIDFDDDDYDDIEDEDDDDVMYIPPPPTEDEESEGVESDSKNSESSLEVSDREFLETVMTKLDKLLSIAESGGFSGSRVAPLTFPKSVNTATSEEEEDNVVDSEPTTNSYTSNSVSDLIGSLNMEKVIQINNKLSGR